MGNIVLYLKLVRRMMGVLLANVVQCHIKVPYFPNESDRYLNFDAEMITRVPIIDVMSNSRHS